MPILTTTIEDNCPLISYSASGGWVQGTSADSFASQYSQSSFTASQTDGASMSFTFNGTGVQIFGARRDNHGTFVISIDGIDFPPIDGHASPFKFQDSLFSTTSLQQRLHTVNLKNTGGNKFVDIDFITWQTNIGKDKEQLVVNTFKDTDPSFKYEPPAAWSTNPDKIGTFLGGSGHAVSTSIGSTLTYVFEGECRLSTHNKQIYSFCIGDGVSLFGPVGPNGSPFSVEIDGGTVRNLSTVKSFFTPQMRIYHADSLGPGNHSLKLVYLPNASGQTFAIDYATVYTTSSIQLQTFTTQPSSSSRLSGGAIAGIAISIIVIILSLSGLAYLLWRRRTQNEQESFERIQNTQMKQPESNPPVFTPPVTSEPERETYYNPGIIPPRKGQRRPISYAQTAQTTTTVPTTSQGHAISSHNQYLTNMSVVGISEDTASSANDEWTPPVAGPSIQRSLPASPDTRRNTKGQVVLLPLSAGQSLANIPEQELRLNRREVVGRAQDFGSVMGSVTPDNYLAPPDYSQATEPYRSQAS